MLAGALSHAAPATKRVELADILAHHSEAFERRHRLPLRHRKVIRAIVACRTAALGGHHQWCDECGFERFVYHSCRNRHCPKCQTQAKEAWRQARQLELLPVPYFHQVFTLPHQLNEWVLAGEGNQRALLKLLFDSASATLLEFGQGEFGGQVGFTLVLHTWDQQLRPHFHLHGLIASGAISNDGSRWIAGGAKFLFPVRALSKKFRGKFWDGFQQLLEAGKLRLPREYAEGAKQVPPLLKKLRKKSWVIYSKAPFAGPAKLLDYLSRYTHRVAISNDRLLACGDGQVTFAYRDRADGDRRKRSTIPADRFIGRFLTHVLPDRFTRIRHYGFLSNRNRKTKLATIRKRLAVRPPEPAITLTAEQWLETVLEIETSRCPCCGKLMREEQIRAADRSRRQLATASQKSRAPPQKNTP